MKLKTLNIQKILENIYMIFFAVFLAQQFLYSTMFEITWPDHFYDDLKVLLFALILLRFAYMKTTNITNLILLGILCIGLLIPWSHNGYSEIYNCFLLIVGARGIDYRKVLKVFLAVVGGLLIVTVAASLTGHVENLVYHQAGRRTRISFGIVYPTDFSAYIFYLSAAYCYLRKNKLKYIELGAMVILAGFVYWFCEARLNTICILLLVLTFGYYKMRRSVCEKKGKIYCMNGGLSMLLALMPSICAGGTLLLSWLYSSDKRLLEILNGMLNNRLYYGKKGLDLYGISLLGQYIPMKGNGGTTEDVIHYFFLDSSYMFILLQYGAVVFGMILFVLCMINFKARAREDWALLIAITVVAIQCVVEHHMMAVAYNPFFFALFAEWSVEKRERNQKKAIGDTL